MILHAVPRLDVYNEVLPIIPRQLPHGIEVRKDEFPERALLCTRCNSVGPCNLQIRVLLYESPLEKLARGGLVSLHGRCRKHIGVSQSLVRVPWSLRT